MTKIEKMTITPQPLKLDAKIFFVYMQNTQVSIYSQYMIPVELLNFSSKIKKTFFFLILLNLLWYISLHRGVMEFVK